ncbi:MAG: SPOR domain-containing protein [Roseicyclus sp.]
MTPIPPAARVVRRSVSIALASGLILSAAACIPAGDLVLGSRNAATDGPAPIGAAPASDRDVEAPEVFDVTDEGLWDGRPSLGGVWVAHRDATDPERVIIRNTETGRFVIGALFRRERENPGPPIQISSEAAAALDILAGDPTSLQLTALRRAEPADDEAIAEEAAPATVAEAAQPDGEASTAEIAEAAPPDPADPGLPAAAAEPGPAAGGILAALGRVFGTGRPAPAPAAPEAASPEAALPETTDPGPTRNMTLEDVASSIRAGDLASAPLEAPRLIPASAPAPALQATALPPLPAAAPSEATRVPAPARRPQTSPDTPLSRAFVQVGLFPVRENAEAAGEALRSAGLVPTIREESGDGRSWRVLVGPAPTVADRTAVLETVRGIGFGDAHFVSR